MVQTEIWEVLVHRGLVFFLPGMLPLPWEQPSASLLEDEITWTEASAVAAEALDI